MLLDRAVAHEQGTRGRGVAAAGRQLLEHLELPLGEAEQGRALLARLASHQALDDLRVQGRAAAGHGLQRTDQLVDLADPLLQQVAEPGDAVGEQVERVVLLDVLREDEHAGLGELGADPLGGVDSLGGEGRGHPDVGEHRVGAVVLHGCVQLDRVGRGRDQLDLRGLRQESGHPLPDEEAVIGEDDAHRHSLTVGPRGGSGVRAAVTTRNRRGDSPRRRAVSSMSAKGRREPSVTDMTTTAAASAPRTPTRPRREASGRCCASTACSSRPRPR